MKTIWASLLAILTTILCSTFEVRAQNIPMVQVLPEGADLGIQVGLTHLPRENPINVAFQATTWPQAAQNAVASLLTGADVVGTNEFNEVRRRGHLLYERMVTSTTFQSWWSLLHSSPGNNQWGNRAHFPTGIWAKKPGVTFRLRDVTQTVRSLRRTSSGWSEDGAISTSTSLEVLNSTRLRLVPAGAPGIIGDTLHPVQDSSMPSLSAGYVGIGVALGAFGAGDSATQLANTVNFYRGRNTAIEVLVSVNYTDTSSGTPVSKTVVGSTVFTTEDIQVQPGAGRYPVTPAYHTALSGDMTQMSVVMSTGTPVPSNHLLQLEASTDLVLWHRVGYPALRGNNTGTLVFPTGEMPGSQQTRCFYRLVTLLPPDGGGAALRGSTGLTPPPADLVTP